MDTILITDLPENSVQKAITHASGTAALTMHCTVHVVVAKQYLTRAMHCTPAITSFPSWPGGACYLPKSRSEALKLFEMETLLSVRGRVMPARIQPVKSAVSCRMNTPPVRRSMCLVCLLHRETCLHLRVSLSILTTPANSPVTSSRKSRVQPQLLPTSTVLP